MFLVDVEKKMITSYLYRTHREQCTFCIMIMYMYKMHGIHFFVVKGLFCKGCSVWNLHETLLQTELKLADLGSWSLSVFDSEVWFYMWFAITSCCDIHSFLLCFWKRKEKTDISCSTGCNKCFSKSRCNL